MSIGKIISVTIPFCRLKILLSGISVGYGERDSEKSLQLLKISMKTIETFWERIKG